MDITMNNKLQQLIERMRVAASKSKSGEINVPVTISSSVCVHGGYGKEELETMTPDKLASSLLELLLAHPAMDNFGDMADNVTLHEITDCNSGETVLQEGEAIPGDDDPLHGDVNPMIRARLENDAGEETVEFTASDVMDYHMPGSNHAWYDLCEEDQISFAEDYALWAFKRKFGDTGNYRVDIL